MNIRLQHSLVTVFLVAALNISACTSDPSPQANPSGESKAAQTWPDSLDAVIAAPENHKILLENDRVRVLEVTLKPHEKEPLHGHRWPSVMYIDQSGDFRDFDSQGKVLFDSRTAKTPIHYPVTQWQEPQAPHAVENLSDKSVHLIRVELKK